jgi:hypothetical protein
MSKGPEQLKFEQAVGEKGSARSQSMDLLVAKQRWHQMAQVLHDSADDLELRAYSAPAVSDQTGAAMQNAFLQTAASMRERAAKLDDGARALGDAATTLHEAEQAKSQMRELNDPGAWTGGTPVTEQELQAKSDHDTALSTYNTDKAHNETIAAQHNQAMDAQNEQSTAVMKKIYGYQDPPPDPGTYGSGSAKAPGTPGSTSGTAPSGGTTTHAGTTSGSHPTWTHSGTSGTHVGAHHLGNPTGTPQGSIGSPAVDAGAIGGSGFTPATPAQATPGSVGSSFGGVGATLGAGIVGGAGGLFGGVRGGATLPTSSAAGARSIGASSRSGGASTLGRTAAGALSAEEEAALQRNGAAGRTGSAAGAGRTGGRGATGRSTTSGRDGRGGAGGQGSRRGKKSGNAQLDHMIIEEDWLDDEGLSPAVID